MKKIPLHVLIALFFILFSSITIIKLIKKDFNVLVPQIFLIWVNSIGALFFGFYLLFKRKRTRI